MPSQGGRPALVRAPFLPRVFAFALDAVLLTAILFLALTLLGLLLGPVVRFLPARGDSSLAAGIVVDHGRAILASIAGILLSAAYFAGFWIVKAATPGQRLLGLRVLRAGDRRPQRWSQAAIRWLFLMGPLCVGALVSNVSVRYRGTADLVAFVWWLLLLLTTLWSRERRGLHDRVSGSFVEAVARDRANASAYAR